MERPLQAQRRDSQLPTSVYFPGSTVGASQHRERQNRDASGWNAGGQGGDEVGRHGDGSGDAHGGVGRHGDGEPEMGEYGEYGEYGSEAEPLGRPAMGDPEVSVCDLATDDVATCDLAFADLAFTDPLLLPGNLLPLPGDGDASAWAAGQRGPQVKEDLFELFDALGDFLDLPEGTLPLADGSASSDVANASSAVGHALTAVGSSHDASSIAPLIECLQEEGVALFLIDRGDPPAGNVLQDRSIAAPEGTPQEGAPSCINNEITPSEGQGFQASSVPSYPGYASGVPLEASIGASTSPGMGPCYTGGGLTVPAILTAVVREQGRMSEGGAPTESSSDPSSSGDPCASSVSRLWQLQNSASNSSHGTPQPPGPGASRASSAPAPLTATSVPAAPGVPSAGVSAVRERLWALIEGEAAARRDAAAAERPAEAKAAPGSEAGTTAADTEGARPGRWGRERGSTVPHLFSSLQQEVLLATDSLFKGSATPAAPLLVPPQEAESQTLSGSGPQNSDPLPPPQSRLQIPPCASQTPLVSVAKGGTSLPTATPVLPWEAACWQTWQETSRKDPPPASEKRVSSLARRLAALLDGIQGSGKAAGPSQKGEAGSRPLLQGAQYLDWTDMGHESHSGSRGAAATAVQGLGPSQGAPSPELAPWSQTGSAVEGPWLSPGTPEASLDSLGLPGARKRRAVPCPTGSQSGFGRGAGSEGGSWWRVEALEEGEAEVDCGSTGGAPYSGGGCRSAGAGLGQGGQGDVGALVCAAPPRAMPSLLSAWHGQNRMLLHPYFKQQVHEQLMRLATAYSGGEPEGSARKQALELKRISSPVGNVTERFAHYMLTALQGRFGAQRVPDRVAPRGGGSLVEAAQENIRHVWGGVTEAAMAQALLPALRGKERIHILVLTLVAVPDWSTLFNGLTAEPGAPLTVTSSTGFQGSDRVTGVACSAGFCLEGAREVASSAGSQGLTGAPGGAAGAAAVGGAGGGGSGGGRGAWARRGLKSVRVTFVVPLIWTATDEQAQKDYSTLCDQVVAAGAARGVPVKATIRFVPLIDFTLPPTALDPRETLVAASWLTLQLLPDETVLRHNPRNTFLQWLREARASTLVAVEVDADLNTQFFIPRFEAILRGAQTMFEACDEVLQWHAPAAGPGGPGATHALERLSALNLMNCAACDGLQRYERAECMDRWRERLRAVGFDEAPFSAASQRDLASLLPHPRRAVLDAQGFLSLRWDDKPLLFVGTWTQAPVA